MYTLKFEYFPNIVRELYDLLIQQNCKFDIFPPNYDDEFEVQVDSEQVASLLTLKYNLAWYDNIH